MKMLIFPRLDCVTLNPSFSQSVAPASESCESIAEIKKSSENAGIDLLADLHSVNIVPLEVIMRILQILGAKFF